MFYGGTAKYTWAAFANGVQPYISGEVGHWDLGTTDSFYGYPAAAAAFAGGIPLPSYTTWNIGVGWTWKVFTVDLRYIDTDLNKADCNAFTGDHTAAPGAGGVTAINPAAMARTGAARPSWPACRPT